MRTRQTRKSVAALGVVLVIVLFLVLSPWRADVPEQVPVAPEVGKSVAAASKSHAMDGGAKGVGEDRTAVEVAVAESEVTAATAPFEFEMEIFARTIEDFPGTSVPIHLAPEFHLLNRTRTDDKGVARVKWRGRVGTMTIVYTSPNDLSGGKRLYRRVVHAGKVARAAVLVKSRSISAGSFDVFTKGGTLRIRGVTSQAGSFQITPGDHRVTRVGNDSSAPPRLHVDKQGWAWFCTGRSGLPMAAARQVEWSVGSSKFVMSGLNLQLGVVGQAPRNPKRPRTLTGIIRDAAGRPVREALVVLGSEWRMRTNARGEYRIEFKLRDGEAIQVRAGGGDHGLAFGDLEIDEKTALSWDAQLDRGIELRGQLLTSDGRPCPGWQVQIEPEDGSPWIDGTTTDKAGRFAIPNVENRAYRLCAFAPKCVLLAFSEREVRPLGDHVFAVWSADPPGTLQAAPRDLERKSMTDVTIRLWDDRSEMGRTFAPGPRPEKIVAGNFRIVLEAAGFELADHTQVQIVANQLTNLGDLTLGERAFLDVSKVRKGVALYRLHPAVLSRVETAGEKIVWLPPGTYRAFGGGKEISFEIKPGANDAPQSIR